MKISRQGSRVLTLAITTAICVSCAAIHQTRLKPKSDAPILIQLDHPDHPGDRGSFEMVYSDLSSKQTTWQGRAPTTEQYSFTYHLITDTRVLDCDAANNATAIQYHIEKLTVLQASREVDLVPPGTDIVATTKTDQTIFTIKGLPPQPKVTGALDVLIRLGNSEESADWKRLLGITTAHRPGENWPLNAAAMAANFDRHGMPISPADITGTIHFTGVESNNGVPCVNVQADVNIAHDYFVAGTQSRDGYVYHTTSSACKMHYQWLAPIAGNEGIHADDFQSSDHYVVVGKYGNWPYEQDCTDDWEQVMRTLPTTRP